MKTFIRTAAVAVAAAGMSNSATPTSANVNQTAEQSARATQANEPFGLCLEDLRVGLTGKVSAEVESTELPVRVAEDVKCRVNSNCN